MMPHATAHHAGSAPRSPRSRWSPRSRRAIALLVVLLALSLAAAVLAGLQAVSFRQAAAGRETVARLRSYWAARAGVESTLAALERSLDAGASGSAFTEAGAMEAVASGELDASSWTIAHDALRQERAGPADPHSRININLMTSEDLMLLDAMTEDVADAILDWIDDDDSPRTLGAEEGYYSTLPSPYTPRNAPIQSLFELELIAGVDPARVRGEDWNLNGRLDPNENDGDLSHPPDNADGVLDAGWSAVITASSLEPGLSSSGGGEQRLDLLTATTEDLISRVSTLDVGQATVILDFASRSDVYLEDLLTNNLRAIAQSSPGLPQGVRNLTNDQIREILASCTLWSASAAPVPGRVNLNTVDRETLDYIASLPPALADAILNARDGNTTGFTSVIDLLDVPAMTPNRVAQLARILGVEAGADVITARGRDTATGTETTIVVTTDRRALPVTLSEVRSR